MFVYPFSFVTGMHSHNSSSRFDVFSLNVRGIRDQAKRRSIFLFLKDQKANIFFYKRPTLNQMMEMFGERNGAESFFSHMAQSIAKVCVF